MERLTLIGYWRSEADPLWPDPNDLVDESWDDDERELTASYLASGTIARAFMGFSRCRLCGIENGNLEYTDGTYLWPQGLAHYVDEHAIRMPESVVSHIERRMHRIEHNPIDRSWWKVAAGSE